MTTAVLEPRVLKGSTLGEMVNELRDTTAFRARYPGKCVRCRAAVRPGDLIVRQLHGYAHHGHAA